MSKKRFKAIYGTRDILADESLRWQVVIDTVERVASICGYGQIMTPIFEATELFSRGMGETSDIVTKEMYTFEDRGNRSLTLRPEGTAPVVRAYIEHSMAMGGGISKVWYAGPMFRQERPQAGRYRQFHQFGLEAIGSLDPALDAEVIGINGKILSELGIENTTLYLNSIGMPEDRELHREAFTAFVKPKLSEFCPDCRKRFEVNPLRMFDCKEENCRRNLEGAPLIYDFLSKENLVHFERVLEYLELQRIAYSIDKKLVRGLDYYTRTAWEFKSSELGSQDSLSGGGRYDLLTEQLGGPPTPGIGFAAGIERILMAMPDVKAGGGDGPRIFIALADDRFKSEAVRLLHTFREKGISADVDYLGRSLKAQMKHANKGGFHYAVILAEDEMQRASAVVRNMRDSSQIDCKLSDIYGVANERELGELFEERNR